MTGDLNQIVGQLTEFGITIADKTIEGINVLAAKLGTSIDKLFPILVKQEFLEGIFYAIVSGIAFALSLLFLVLTLRSDDEYKIYYILFGIGFLGLTLIFTFHAITHLGNPQYEALETIYDFVDNFRRGNTGGR